MYGGEYYYVLMFMMMFYNSCFHCCIYSTIELIECKQKLNKKIIECQIQIEKKKEEPQNPKWQSLTRGTPFVPGRATTRD